MEVYFVDVGQGTCQIILLGGQRAIVVDCGVKSDHIALQFLKRHGVTRLECLITSHSDNDHTGGAISILNSFADNIGFIFVIQDHKFLDSKYWRRLDFLEQSGVLTGQQIFPLAIEAKPRLLWEESGSRLRCFSPAFIENLRSQDNANVNSTSAVLVLDHLGKRIVFAADSVIEQWKLIHQRMGNQPLICDALAVAHHGGLCNDKPGDLDWLYDEAIKSDFAILSVGTVKNPKHPRPEVVAKLRSVGSTVLCTEITKQCHFDPRSLKPGVLQPQVHLGRAVDNHAYQWTACVGTIQVEISATGVAIDGFKLHQNAVEALAEKSEKGICPLCRR